MLIVAVVPTSSTSLVPSLDSFIASISDSSVRILARNDVRSLEIIIITIIIIIISIIIIITTTIIIKKGINISTINIPHISIISYRSDSSF